MFDFSKAQEITDQIIELQNLLQFTEAADLYLKVIAEIESSPLRSENETEWINNLLSDQTREILFLAE
jgi:hypothetical protein